jgi:hypothetical protein
MSVDLAYDLWSELKRYIGAVDKTEAADALVNLLIDHDYDADDIRSAFKGDSEVKRALEVYIDDLGLEEDDDEDTEDDDYEDDDEDY